MEVTGLVFICIVFVIGLVMCIFCCLQCCSSETALTDTSSANVPLVEESLSQSSSIRYGNNSGSPSTIVSFPVNPAVRKIQQAQANVQCPNPFRALSPPKAGFKVNHGNQSSYQPLIDSGNGEQRITIVEQYSKPSLPAPSSPDLTINKINQSTVHPTSASPKPPLIEASATQTVENEQHPKVSFRLQPRPLKPPKRGFGYPGDDIKKKSCSPLIPLGLPSTTIETKYRTPSASNTGCIKITTPIKATSHQNETSGNVAASTIVLSQSEISRPSYPTSTSLHSTIPVCHIPTSITHSPPKETVSKCSEPPPPSYAEAIRESQSSVPKEEIPELKAYR